MLKIGNRDGIPGHALTKEVYASGRDPDKVAAILEQHSVPTNSTLVCSSVAEKVKKAISQLPNDEFQQVA